MRSFLSSSMCLWVSSFSCLCSVFIGMLMFTRSFLFLYLKENIHPSRVADPNPAEAGPFWLGPDPENFHRILLVLSLLRQCKVVWTRINILKIEVLHIFRCIFPFFKKKIIIIQISEEIRLMWKNLDVWIDSWYLSASRLGTDPEPDPVFKILICWIRIPPKMNRICNPVR